jgi:hypothetical protein
MPLFHMNDIEWCNWRERNDIREAIKAENLL